MRRLGHITPADDHGADDHQIIDNHRSVGPPAVGAQQSELFVQRSRPDRLARLAVDALKITAHARRIDASRRRVPRHTGPTDTFRGHVREVNVETVLPEDLAGRRIGTDDLFAFAFGFRIGATH